MGGPRAAAFASIALQVLLELQDFRDTWMWYKYKVAQDFSRGASLFTNNYLNATLKQQETPSDVVLSIKLVV